MSWVLPAMLECLAVATISKVSWIAMTVGTDMSAFGYLLVYGFFTGMLLALHSFTMCRWLSSSATPDDVRLETWRRWMRSSAVGSSVLLVMIIGATFLDVMSATP